MTTFPLREVVRACRQARTLSSTGRTCSADPAWMSWITQTGRAAGDPERFRQPDPAGAQAGACARLSIPVRKSRHVRTFAARGRGTSSRRSAPKGRR
jgi:hypothetical protein